MGVKRLFLSGMVEWPCSILGAYVAAQPPRVTPEQDLNVEVG